MPARAIIISIGDEILYGQTLDTNAHWLSGELDKAGIQVVRRLTIGDQREDILNTLKTAEESADILLLTGGLGPTSDDLTKPCLLEYFQTDLRRDEEVLQHIIQLFTARGREVSEVNKAQADLPSNSIAIPNPLGTAPGIWIEENNKVYVSMPGVPYEMERMMTDTILPNLQKKYNIGGVYHRMIRTIGIPESTLAELIHDWESNLPPHIKLAYLPTRGSVKLRLTTKGTDEAHLQSQMQEQIDQVMPVIAKYVYGFDSEEIEEAIGRMLLERSKTLAIAESCTGGHLSHKITSVAGSSQWFKGGFVPYSNDIKNQHLKVPQAMLEAHGAVSEPVVQEMAQNVRALFGTDVGISISGIAGPSGGSKEKPVGTVWIGYADEKRTIGKKFQFVKDRSLNIQFTTMTALNMIRIYLDKE